VRDLADDGVANESANLRSIHSDLAELSSVGTTLGGINETFEDTRIRDRRERHGDGVWRCLCDLVEIQLSGEIRGLTGVAEDGTDGGEKQIEVDLVQIDELRESLTGIKDE